MKSINRIFEYLEYHKIKPAHFERDLGLSNGYLGTQRKRSADLGSTIVEKIMNHCDDLNLTWLITGEGEMLVSNSPNNMDCSKCPFKKDIERYQRDLDRYEKMIDGLNKKLDALTALEDPESKLKNAS
jgi:hypothetical protein